MAVLFGDTITQIHNLNIPDFQKGFEFIILFQLMISNTN